MADEQSENPPVSPDQTDTPNTDHADGDSSTDWTAKSPITGEKLKPVSVEVETSEIVEWNEENQSAALPFPVVGIGASAGGLQAFQELLDNLPEKTGMAYVILSHLAADKPSHLSEILSRHTKTPIDSIEEGTRPEPDHIYVLMPAQRARIVGGTFRLEARTASQKVHFPIDDFFRSLSTDQKSFCIGVVMSGADSDGTMGLQAIKGEGGLSMAQSPETAEQPSMPISSIEMDHVDFVGAPAEIAAELARLAVLFKQPQISTLESGLAVPNEEQSLRKIFQTLRNLTGLDLRQYRQETIRRRLGRRMVMRRIDSLSEYAQFLQLHHDEVRILHEEVLISVTRFFRDTEFWQAVSAQVLPALFQNRPPERSIRIWCAGSATGEEAYSFAITVLEYLNANGLHSTVQVFATDASENAIQKSRTATYPESIAAELSPARIRKFFVKVERGYQVSKRVRDCCIFARHNLASDPPFSHIDMLSCRNVLIYFNQSLQRQLISTFHYALEPEGYLMLGMSEGLRNYTAYFNPFDRKHRIYSKIGGDSPHGHRPTVGMILSDRTASVPLTAPNFSGEGWPELELQRAADRIVLARYAPPGLIVDEKLNVLQARGHTAPYVRLSPGAVSWNLSRVLHGQISTEVKAAIERSIDEDIPVSIMSSMSLDGDESGSLRVEVLPITSISARLRCFLVLFSRREGRQETKVLDQVFAPDLTVDGNNTIVDQLREDLNSTRYHLQTLIEERDARNQELVSANEEIQSANEELQSTNEELETTKEELQSAIEELQTVNDELQQRNAALTQTGNDLMNLLNSVNMPLLMLTDELKIRQFTPPIERLLNIRTADLGRSISEIRMQLDLENIEPILQEVLDTLGTREVEVRDKEGKWFLLRIRPYRTAENKIDGLVILLVDIDQLRTSRQELRVARDFADCVVQSVPVPVVVLHTDGAIRAVNKAFCELSRIKDSELTGRSFPDLVDHLWGLDGLKLKLDELFQAEANTILEFEHSSTTSQRKDLLFKGQALPIGPDCVLLLTIDDVTLRRSAEEVVTRQHEELQSEFEVKDRTLSRTQEQLRDLAAHLFSMQEEERQRVARELHDDISQRLSLLEIACSKEESSDGKNMTEIRKQVHDLNTSVRGISHRLHPAILNDLGIAAALKSLVDDFRLREGMPANYLHTDVPDNLPQEVSTALYRITQEALRNVSKHAGETHVKVTLQGIDGVVQLQVRDFGNGYDQDVEYPLRGLGLVSMEERARIAGGTFSVTSSLGEGTNIVVEIPLESNV